MRSAAPQKKSYSYVRFLWIALAGALSAFVCVAILASGAGNPSNPTPTPAPAADAAATAQPATGSPSSGSAQYVDLSLDPDLQGTTLSIQGTTDLPDRTLLLYDVAHEEMTTRSDVPFDKLHTDGNLEVSGGRYATQVDLTGWPGGDLQVWVGFQTVLGVGTKQPDEIIERFGEAGEFLAGENVTETISGSFKRAEVIRFITWSSP
jgi:hypothetical protein